MKPAGLYWDCQHIRRRCRGLEEEEEEEEGGEGMRRRMRKRRV